ncbi:MAG: phosphoribosylglycinamide formyltransferase [Gallionellaceae bacterium]|nr:MAG: phosphoribosylglycinamide formyltransferase [Gallionellaceae bacterium]
MKKVVILISGRGSNMQALLEAKLPCQIVAVISNRADATGLEIAKAHGIATAVVSHREHADRAAFDMALAQVIDGFQAELVVLAGFMRILTTPFVERYHGKLVNIHPSLLPSYTGIDTHERALQDGVKIHGCTVHFVTPTLDGGPIIIQAAVPVLHDDTEASLSARVLHEEHRIYPQALRWLCREQVWLDTAGRVVSNRLEQPGTALVSPGLS